MVVLKRRFLRGGIGRVLLLSALAVPAASCGGGGGGGGGERLPGPGGRIDPIYDAMVHYPDDIVIVGGVEHHGILLDIELRFDEATLRDADPSFEAEARVASVVAGGVPLAFSVPLPLVVEGLIDGDAFETGLFGPIRFGTANVILSLSGVIAPGRGTVGGVAGLFGTASQGAFTATRRRRYLLAGTDLQTIGEASEIFVRHGSAIEVRDNLETISSDPTARVEDARPFILNRLSFDNVQGLDPDTGFKAAFQYSAGNGANPHDLVVLTDLQAGFPAATAPGAAGVAFVTRYEPPYDDIAVIDLDDGSLLDSIDLVPYARNPDHLPRADQILKAGGKLFVTLQDANRSFTQFMTGRVVVIDPTLRAVEQVIDLAGQNPFESMVLDEGTGLIYIAMAGIFPGLRPQALTGGIEVLDTAARQSLGIRGDDDTLGGNVSAVTIASATRGYAVVTDTTYRNFVKAFNPTTGEVLGTVHETSDRIAALLADGDGWLLIAESSFVSPRLLILDAATAQPVASLPLRLPPLSAAILTQSL